MSSNEQQRKLIETAQTIKDFCINYACGSCQFYRERSGEFYFYRCEFYENVPWHWDLSDKEDCDGNEQRRTD